MGSSNTGGDKDESPADGGKARAPRSGSESPDGAAATYFEGEKVLAYHGPAIYEAKVQKSELRKDEWKYFVHYLGWSKNWDEWVGTDRLLKYNEGNIRKQQALKKHSSADKNAKSGRTTQNKPKGSTGRCAEVKRFRGVMDYESGTRAPPFTPNASIPALGDNLNSLDAFEVKDEDFVQMETFCTRPPLSMPFSHPQSSSTSIPYRATTSENQLPKKKT